MDIDKMAMAELAKLGVKKKPEPKRTTSWETNYVPDEKPYDDWVNRPRAKSSRPRSFYDAPLRTPREPEGADRLRRIAKTEWELEGEYDATLSERGRDQIITVLCSELAKLMEAGGFNPPTTVELYPIIEDVLEDCAHWDGSGTRDVIRD